MPPRVRSCCYFSIFNKENNQRNELMTVINHFWYGDDFSQNTECSWSAHSYLSISYLLIAVSCISLPWTSGHLILCCDHSEPVSQHVCQRASACLPHLSEHSSCVFPRRSCQGFMHMKLTQCKDGKYVLGQNSPPFDTIPEVIHFYTTHKLPVRGAEHLSLLFPVLVQTLWLPSKVCLDLQELFPMDTWTRMSSASVLVKLDTSNSSRHRLKPTASTAAVPNVWNIQDLHHNGGSIHQPWCNFCHSFPNQRTGTAGVLFPYSLYSTAEWNPADLGGTCVFSSECTQIAVDLV